MFENTNFVIIIVFENTNCLLHSKQHDRLNNRQSGHGNGPCQKSKSSHNFSIFLFTNSLKSLPFSKFFEIKAKLCYPKMSEWVPVSIITNTSRLSSLAQTSNQSGLM